MFNKLLAAIRWADDHIFKRADLVQQKLVNAIQRDPNAGALEKRFTPLRILGGYHLARTGKHRGTTMPYSAVQNPAGTKLWKKAAKV
jgi:hypothetical protein